MIMVIPYLIAESDDSSIETVFTIKRTGWQLRAITHILPLDVAIPTS